MKVPKTWNPLTNIKEWKNCKNCKSFGIRHESGKKGIVTNSAYCLYCQPFGHRELFNEFRAIRALQTRIHHLNFVKR